MATYHDLDAWKVSHALVLATYQATTPLSETGTDLLLALRRTALKAAGRLARGAGIQHRKAFAACVDLAAGYLAEFAYHLRFARDTGVLRREVWQELDALRGRAAFYTWKLYLSLANPAGGDRRDRA
jgi:four helix bundle protein